MSERLEKRIAALSRDWHSTIDPEDAYHTAFAKKLTGLLNHHGERVWAIVSPDGKPLDLASGPGAHPTRETVPALLIPLEEE